MAQDRGNLFDGRGQHDDQRELAVGGQPIALIDSSFGLGNNDAFTRDNAAKRFDDVGAALDEHSVRHRHSHRRSRNAASIARSALARLIPRIGLVDDVDSPLAAHNAATLVPLLQCLQRIDDLHIRNPWSGSKHRDEPWRCQTPETARYPAPLRVPWLCYQPEASAKSRSRGRLTKSLRPERKDLMLRAA